MNDLKDTLRQVHQQLETSKGVDAELAELLRALDQDIHQLLASEAGSQEESEPLTERAREIAARFASEHPQLEKVLRELADKLASIGI